MGFKFRKSIKIAPNVKLNVTKNGVSSLSVGKNGARVNIGKTGIRQTVGINGSGLSYSHHQSYRQNASLDLSLDIVNQLMQIAKENAIQIYELYMADEYSQEATQEQINHIASQLSSLPKTQQDEGLEIYTTQFEFWVEYLQKAHQKWIDNGYDENEFSPAQEMLEIKEQAQTTFMIWGIGLVGLVMMAIILYKMFT